MHIGASSSGHAKRVGSGAGAAHDIPSRQLACYWPGSRSFAKSPNSCKLWEQKLKGGYNSDQLKLEFKRAAVLWSRSRTGPLRDERLSRSSGTSLLSSLSISRESLRSNVMLIFPCQYTLYVALCDPDLKSSLEGGGPCSGRGCQSL